MRGPRPEGDADKKMLSHQGVSFLFTMYYLLIPIHFMNMSLDLSWTILRRMNLLPFRHRLEFRMNNQPRRLYVSNVTMVILHYITGGLLLLVIFNNSAGFAQKAVGIFLAAGIIIVALKHIAIVEVFPTFLIIRKTWKRERIGYEKIDCIEQSFGWLWKIVLFEPQNTVYFYNLANREMTEFLRSKVKVVPLPTYRDMMKK